MKIIKIEPQPTAAGLISAMNNGETLHFDICHGRAVQEAASRKMKSVSPNYKFPTVVDKEKEIIQVTKESI